MHATLKNLELLAEGGTVTGALSQATERKIVTVQPWVEERDGKRFLCIPEGAGYRNLRREMPPAAAFRRPEDSSGGEAAMPKTGSPAAGRRAMSR